MDRRRSQSSRVREMCGGSLEVTSWPGLPKRSVIGGARTSISEVHLALEKNPVIVAHRGKSSSATRRQCRHMCVTPIQPSFCSPYQVAHRRVEVKDMREELGRQSGDRREDVAMRKAGS